MTKMQHTGILMDVQNTLCFQATGYITDADLFPSFVHVLGHKIL